MEVSLNYCSQNGGNVYRAPYYSRNLNIGPRIDSNLGQSPYSQSTRFSTLSILLAVILLPLASMTIADALAIAPNSTCCLYSYYSDLC